MRDKLIKLGQKLFTGVGLLQTLFVVSFMAMLLGYYVTAYQTTTNPQSVLAETAYPSGCCSNDDGPISTCSTTESCRISNGACGPGGMSCGAIECKSNTSVCSGSWECCSGSCTSNTCTGGETFTPRSSEQVCTAKGGTKSSSNIADPNCSANGGTSCDITGTNFCCYGDSSTRADGDCYNAGNKSVTCSGNTITNNTDYVIKIRHFTQGLNNYTCPLSTAAGNDTDLGIGQSITASGCEQLDAYNPYPPIVGYCGVCSSTTCFPPPPPPTSTPVPPTSTPIPPTSTPTPTSTPVPSFTPTPRVTVTPTITPKISPTITPTISPTITPTPTPSKGKLQICKFEDDNQNGIRDNGEVGLRWNFQYQVNNGSWIDYLTTDDWWRFWLERGCGDLIILNHGDVVNVKEFDKEGWRHTTPTTQQVTIQENLIRVLQFGNVPNIVPTNTPTMTPTGTLTPTPTATLTPTPFPTGTLTPTPTPNPTFTPTPTKPQVQGAVAPPIAPKSGGPTDLTLGLIEIGFVGLILRAALLLL